MINPHLRTAYLVDLAAAVEKIGRLRWTLAQAIAVADDAPRLTDVELRTLRPVNKVQSTAVSQTIPRPASPGRGMTIAL